MGHISKRCNLFLLQFSVISLIPFSLQRNYQFFLRVVNLTHNETYVRKRPKAKHRQLFVLISFSVVAFTDYPHVLFMKVSVSERIA